MNLTHPLLPMAGIALLTSVVWIRLYVERIGEMRTKGIAPQSLASSQKAAGLLANTQAADNFRNLFEVPVLFYVLCLAIHVTNMQEFGFLVGCWSYVILRAIHSYIHCTYNKVMHRFSVYCVSTILLFIMWGAFGVKLLNS